LQGGVEQLPELPHLVRRGGADHRRIDAILGGQVGDAGNGEQIELRPARLDTDEEGHAQRQQQDSFHHWVHHGMRRFPESAKAFSRCRTTGSFPEGVPMTSTTSMRK